MEKIAFIGSYDKADMITYIAKILTIMNKKVLVVDSTALQKTRYIVPSMQAIRQYITTFERVDIAIGFENIEQIKSYKKEEEGNEFDYDYVLIDIDSYKGYYNFKIQTEDKKFFVTSFDIYCLRRGLQVFRKLETLTPVTKVLFTKEMLSEENEYLNYLSKGLKIKWNSDIIFFPFELGDQNVIYSNQRSGKIRIKGLSSQYIDGIRYITEEISGANPNEVKKATKILERN